VSADPVLATPTLQHILQHAGVFRRGDEPRLPSAVIPSGFSAIDAQLPGGGWPVPGFVELLCDSVGVGELAMWLPVHRALNHRALNHRALNHRALNVEACTNALWIHAYQTRGRGHQAIPNAPAFAAQGIDLSNIAFVQPPSDEASLWACEQALLSRSVGLVLTVLTQQHASSMALRRIAQAARASERVSTSASERASASGGTLCVLLRACAAASSPSPAQIRIVAQPTEAGRLHLQFIKRQGLAGESSVDIQPIDMACLSRDRVLSTIQKQEQRTTMKVRTQWLTQAGREAAQEALSAHAAHVRPQSPYPGR
jgi:protein ImuA